MNFAGKTYYSITELCLQPDFNERLAMTKINVKNLRLGPIQSKKYFEAVAVVHKISEETGGILMDENIDLLMRYYQKYRWWK